MKGMDEQMFRGRRREGVMLIVEPRVWKAVVSGQDWSLNPDVGSQHSALSLAPVSPLSPPPLLGPKQVSSACSLPSGVLSLPTLPHDTSWGALLPGKPLGSSTHLETGRGSSTGPNGLLWPSSE